MSETDQKERLAELGRLEAKLERLREKEVEIEVDCITAETALEHTVLERAAGIDIKTAAAIVLSLDRQRELAQTRVRHQPEGEKKTHSIRAGLDALRAWLEAGERRTDQGGSPVIKGVFMVIALVIVGAAIAVHWAFLILLVPLGATSAMMWSGNDASWQRVGARRRFEQTGLSLPDGWTAQAVQEQIQALEQLIDSVSGAQPDSSEPDSTQGLAEAAGDPLEDVEQELAAVLSSAGLSESGLAADTERELRAMSRKFIANRELAEVKSALSRVGSEAELIRSGLYRYLNQQGVGAGEGQADSATLAAGLTRLDDRTKDD